MITQLGVVTIYVHDQEEALAFYTDKLGFEKRADASMGPARWVTVAPKNQHSPQIALVEPVPAFHGEETATQLKARVGQNPTWSFQTDDCRKTYEELLARGVEFVNPPSEQFYGVEAIFKDLYGNTFSLLQPAE